MGGGLQASHRPDSFPSCLDGEEKGPLAMSIYECICMSHPSVRCLNDEKSYLEIWKPGLEGLGAI